NSTTAITDKRDESLRRIMKSFVRGGVTLLRACGKTIY
ncbi:unnamed protein product, partial [marine sediment metagenome]